MYFFTDPYKDELIYSAIARYHYYVGNEDLKDTIEECFNKRSIVPSLLIGSNLETLAKNLGEKYLAEYIIKNHTIFPFYSPFLPKKRREELINQIKCKDGNGIYSRMGIIAGSICVKREIYYCPRCAKKDIEEKGEPYIHREHQLQGVYLCPHDGVELKKYLINRNNTSRIEFIRLDEKILYFDETNILDKKHHEMLIKMSEGSYFLLKSNLGYISKEKVLERYKNLLYERGLTTSNKSIKQDELFKEVSLFYNKDFLELMESEIDNNYEYNWLRNVTRNLNRTVHPIRHLLLINFLEKDTGIFLKNIDKKFQPFGEGPWPCLNKVASHYNKDVIKNVTISEDYKTRLPVGTFSCDCGFIYSRKGPDKLYEDRYKIGRIKCFGSLWEDKLKDCLGQGKRSLREAARNMHCDPKTIVKFDKKLGINYFENSAIQVENSNNKVNCEDKSKLYKSTIIRTIKSNKGIIRSKVKDKCKKEYSYLYRIDRIWLENNLPPKLQGRRLNKATVDWHKRDIEIKELVKAKYNELVNNETPIRITKSIIGKTLGILPMLEKNIGKLPETKIYLYSIIENVETFRIRRCKIIIDRMFENNEEFKLWELKRIAGISSSNFKRIESQVLDYLNQRI